MIKNKILQNKNCLSCVIYTDKIRYAVINKQPEAIKIVTHGVLSLPLKKDKNSNIELLALKKSKAIIAIANQLSHLKLKTIDSNINSLELKRYIQLNAFNFFEYTYNALYLDYRLIFQKLHVLSIRKNQKYLQLLAAKKNDLNQAILALKLLKIKFSMISIECIAWINLIRKFLKPKINIYMIIFFKKDNFSILVVEKNYLIYKNKFSFFSNYGFSKSEYVIQSISLVKSLYPSVILNYYIIMGEKSNIIQLDSLEGKFNYFNLSSFLKINLSDKVLHYYYSLVGLTI